VTSWPDVIIVSLLALAAAWALASIVPEVLRAFSRDRQP